MNNLDILKEYLPQIVYDRTIQQIFSSKKKIQTLMKVMWALSSFILFWGLVNYVCCYDNQNKRPLRTKIIPLSFFICSLILGIFLFKERYQFNNTNGIINQNQNKVENCLEHQWSENLESTYIWALQKFCQFDCQCYIENNDLAIRYGLFNYTTIPSNVTRIQNCQGINQQNYTKQIRYLSFVETKFKCAGWCSIQKYHLFSDINNLVPQTESQGCYKYTAQYIDNNLYILGVSSFIVMTFQAVYLLTSNLFRAMFFNHFGKQHALI